MSTIFDLFIFYVLFLSILKQGLILQKGAIEMIPVTIIKTGIVLFLQN